MSLEESEDIASTYQNTLKSYSLAERIFLDDIYDNLDQKVKSYFSDPAIKQFHYEYDLPFLSLKLENRKIVLY